MKRGLVLFGSCLIATVAWSDNLIDIFQRALGNDPTYQKAILKELSSVENIKINTANFLPRITFDAQPLTDNQVNSGAFVASNLQPPHNVLRSFNMRLTLKQNIFNFAHFAQLSQAKLSHQQAQAKLNAQYQDLILRVVQAYFNVLHAENNLEYFLANKQTLAKQLTQIKEKYRVGKANVNDIDVAQSSLSNAESEYINAQTRLIEHQEYLTKITNYNAHHLAALNKRLPLVNPKPANMKDWVETAIRQNWAIHAQKIGLQVAKQKLKEQYSGHLPTVRAEVYYNSQGIFSKNGSLIVAAGSSRQKNAIGFLSLHVPIFSGGLVVATVKKFQYQLQIAQRNLDETMRDVAFDTKKSYLRIVADLQKLKSNKQAVASAQSSYNSLRERYTVGAGRLIDTLTQQDKLLHSQLEYNNAKYNYIIELLKLKKAAGILSMEDLYIVNSWLGY